MAADEKPADARGFAKHLASTEKRMRDKAVSALQTFLSVRSDFSEIDMMKVWRGLFYCFWHSDKAPVQENLAESLASVMHGLSEEVCELYLRVFLKTLRREWGGIDKLRLDKFYMLVRRFLQHMLRRVDEQDWTDEAVGEFVSILQECTLLVEDNYPAGSLNYHLTDIYLPEVSTITQSLPFSSLCALIEPFVLALASSLDKTYIKRIREGVLGPLLRGHEDDAPAVPCSDIDHAALASRMFELGAADATHPPNRRVLYELSEAFKKAGRESRARGGGDRPVKKARVEETGEEEEAEDEEEDKSRKGAGNSLVGRASFDDRSKVVKRAKRKGRLVLMGTAETMNEWGVPVADGGSGEDGDSGSDDDGEGEAGKKGKKVGGKKDRDASAKEEKKKKKKKKRDDGGAAGNPGKGAPGAPAAVGQVPAAKSGDKKSAQAKGTPAQGASAAGSPGPGNDAVISNLDSLFAMAGPGRGSAGGAQGNGNVAKKKKKKDGADKKKGKQGGGKEGEWRDGSGGDGPGSSKKKMKTQSEEERQVGDTPAGTPAGAQTTGHKGPLATPSPNGTLSTPAATPAAASTVKKRVRFSLKNNLEFEPDSVPLPPDLRTPERSQPHGPALKKVSKWPNSAPPGKGKRKLGREKIAHRVATPGAKAPGGGGQHWSGSMFATPPAMRGVQGSRQRAADFF
eukprot:jgi/Mesvir1/24935/Mv16912-RA.1